MESNLKAIIQAGKNRVNDGAAVFMDMDVIVVSEDKSPHL